jgi:deoxyribose-phosphate aldolase
MQNKLHFTVQLSPRFKYFCRLIPQIFINPTFNRYTLNALNQYLESTLLRPDTTLSDVKKLCEQAQQLQLAGVCIPPLYVRDAKRMLESSRLKVVTVIGFPMGYSGIAAKTEEIKRATDDGADEVDGVINLAALKSGNWNHVENDLNGMALAANMRGKVLKVILEMGLLNLEETDRVCKLAIAARAQFLKTGTGFNAGPVTVDMIKTLKHLAGNSLKIKASGGVRTPALALQLVEAGADRIGCSTVADLLV